MKTGFKVCLSNATCSATPRPHALKISKTTPFGGIKIAIVAVGLCRLNQVDP
jgi:hypothetical protein